MIQAAALFLHIYFTQPAPAREHCQTFAQGFLTALPSGSRP